LELHNPFFDVGDLTIVDQGGKTPTGISVGKSAPLKKLGLQG